MEKSSVVIEEIGEPIILVNGIKFELLCEFESAAKNSRFQSVYREELGNDVLVKVNKDTAVAGLFSLEEGKMKQLFDYIEAQITQKDGLVCYESESFPRFLHLAAEAGGRYPNIQKQVNPHKNNFFTDLLQPLRPRRSLDRALQEQILAHTVQIEYGQSKSTLEDALQDRNNMEILGSMKIDEYSTMYAVALEPGFVVDVKVRTDTGLVYVMENEDGSCVYDGACADYTFPDYNFDEAAVVQFVRETLSKPTLSDKIACAEASQRVLQVSESQISSYVKLSSQDPFER